MQEVHLQLQIGAILFWDEWTKKVILKIVIDLFYTLGAGFLER